jgi:hypothetical protein
MQTRMRRRRRPPLGTDAESCTAASGRRTGVAPAEAAGEPFVRSLPGYGLRGTVDARDRPLTAPARALLEFVRGRERLRPASSAP